MVTSLGPKRLEGKYGKTPAASRQGTISLAEHKSCLRESSGFVGIAMVILNNSEITGFADLVRQTSYLGDR